MVERATDPPEHVHCEECWTTFFPGSKEWEDGEIVLCHDCANFDG